MSTFTREQMNQILQAVKGTGGKKMGTRIDQILALPEKKMSADKIVDMLNGSRKDGALKKPKNAWQLYLADFRKGDQVKEGMNGAAIVKLASPIWNGMSAAEKKPFEAEAAGLSAAYKEAKGEKSPKKKSGEKRSPNAWMLFLADYRKEHSEPGMAGSAVAKAGGEVWREMSAEKKAPYEDKAATLKAEWNARKEDTKDNGVKPKEEEKKEEEVKPKKKKEKKVKKEEVAPPPVVEEDSDEEDSDVEDSDDDN